METNNTPPPIPIGPALWNPNAAGCWSLIFTPAFGAYIHSKNAEVLGRTEEANINRKWLYMVSAFQIFLLFSDFLPEVLEKLSWKASIVIILSWYFTVGKKQAVFVKSTYNEKYQRKPWKIPILLGIAYLAVYFVLAVLIDIAHNKLTGVE